MKRYVITTILASVLGFSLLMAEETTIQQADATKCCKGTQCCGKSKNLKTLKNKAEKAVTNFQAKAESAKAKGKTEQADLFTNCANAKQKVADSAKAAIECMQTCKANKDTEKSADIRKQCEQVRANLAAAQDEAAKAEKALKEYKKTKKAKK